MPKIQSVSTVLVTSVAINGEKIDCVKDCGSDIKGTCSKNECHILRCRQTSQFCITRCLKPTQDWFYKFTWLLKPKAVSAYPIHNVDLYWKSPKINWEIVAEDNIKNTRQCACVHLSQLVRWASVQMMSKWNLSQETDLQAILSWTIFPAEGSSISMNQQIPGCII